jgi:Protein of unknown function (DUF3617)
MRPAIILVASLAALSLSACSESATDKGGVSEADVRAELASARALNAGQYESSFELARFDVPGMPAQEQTMIREMMGSAAQVQQSYCLTEDQARRGSEDMFREMARGNGECEFQSFNVSGETVTGELTCNARGGASATMRMNGTLGDDQSTMSMVTDITDPSLPQGRAQMEMRVTSRRTGDCTAESRAAAEAAEKNRPSAAE